MSRSGEHLRLWEPGHGEVTARCRDPLQHYAPGTRAYASAGLLGAEWWVEGAGGPVEDAVVDLGEVAQFYSDHGLWTGLTGEG